MLVPSASSASSELSSMYPRRETLIPRSVSIELGNLETPRALDPVEMAS